MAHNGNPDRTQALTQEALHKNPYEHQHACRRRLSQLSDLVLVPNSPFLVATRWNMLYLVQKATGMELAQFRRDFHEEIDNPKLYLLDQFVITAGGAWDIHAVIEKYNHIRQERQRRKVQRQLQRRRCGGHDDDDEGGDGEGHDDDLCERIELEISPDIVFEKDDAQAMAYIDMHYSFAGRHIRFSRNNIMFLSNGGIISVWENRMMRRPWDKIEHSISRLNLGL